MLLGTLIHVNLEAETQDDEECFHVETLFSVPIVCKINLKVQANPENLHQHRIHNKGTSTTSGGGLPYGINYTLK